MRVIGTLLLTGMLLSASAVAGGFREESVLPAMDSNSPVTGDLSRYVLPAAKVLDPFQLIDQDNRIFDRSRLTGKWSLIFFGYTYCPDICPMALTLLKQIFQVLEESPRVIEQLQGVFVSVDPKRDSTQALKKYVTYFNPGFLGLTGEPGQIDALSHQMAVRYSVFYSWESEDAYLIDHTASLYLVDPEARLYAAFPPPYGVQDVVEALLAILPGADNKNSPAIPSG